MEWTEAELKAKFSEMNKYIENVFDRLRKKETVPVVNIASYLASTVGATLGYSHLQRGCTPSLFDSTVHYAEYDYTHLMRPVLLDPDFLFPSRLSLKNYAVDLLYTKYKPDGGQIFDEESLWLLVLGRRQITVTANPTCFITGTLLVPPELTTPEEINQYVKDNYSSVLWDNPTINRREETFEVYDEKGHEISSDNHTL